MKPELFRYYRTGCGFFPYKKRNVPSSGLTKAFRQGDKVLVIDAFPSKDLAKFGGGWSLKVIAPGGPCYFDVDLDGNLEMFGLKKLPVEDMNEVEPPQFGKLYMTKALNLLYQDKRLTKAYFGNEMSTRVGRPVMITSAQKVRGNTLHQHWLLKIISGEDIGWVATSRNWTDDFEYA